jgi:hypothetical protein
MPFATSTTANIMPTLPKIDITDLIVSSKKWTSAATTGITDVTVPLLLTVVPVMPFRAVACDIDDTRTMNPIRINSNI